VSGHQASLAADHEQNAPVAEDEDDEDDDVERQEIPDAERLLSRLTLPQNYLVESAMQTDCWKSVLLSNRDQDRRV